LRRIAVGFFKHVEGHEDERNGKGFGLYFQKNAPTGLPDSVVTFEDMLEKKRMEWLKGRYKNGGEFEQCIGYLIDRGSPRRIFDKL
jgi:hypothetical protein